MAARIDVQLESLDNLAEAPTALLKAGQQVVLRETDAGSLAVETSDGLVLGNVPARQAAELRGGEFNGHIRTIKRDPGTSSIKSLMIRFVRGERALRPAVAFPSQAEEEDNNVMKLSREQLQQLADDDDLRRFLRDERLQKVVLEIDGAPNREEALKSMLKAPNFKEFTDKIISLVAPSIPE